MVKYDNLFTIIICPPKALASFERELSEKLKVSYSIISTDKTVLNKGRFLVISNTCIDKSISKIRELSQTFNLVGIIDEAHQGLQSPNTKFYKQILMIRKLFPIMYYTTATTCKNNIMGMYHMLSLLNPNILGDLKWFRSRYLIINSRKITQTTRNKNKVQRRIEEIVGYKNVEELQSRLEQYIIVRQKQYNLSFSYHRVKPNDYEVKAYLAASNGKLSEKAEDFWSVRLRDITFVVDNIHPDYDSEKISNKERLFLKVLLNNIQLKRPTIIYCEYVSVLERLITLMEVVDSVKVVKTLDERREKGIVK